MLRSQSVHRGVRTVGGRTPTRASRARLRSRGLLASGALSVAGALVLGLVPGMVGSAAVGAGEVVAPESWGDGGADLAVASPLGEGSGLPGTAGAVRYSFGVDYRGALEGTSGVAVTGQAHPQGTITLLEGDSLDGSAVVWDDAASGSGIGIAGIADRSRSANLGGQLTGAGFLDDELGASQLRWAISGATAEAVNASATEPAALRVGSVDGSGPSGDVAVFVARPELTTVLEACSAGADCDSQAPLGEGGWSPTAAVAPDAAEVVWRVTATNTGNVDMHDVAVATAEGGDGDLSACVGESLGDVPVGAHASVTCSTSATGPGSVSMGVSGTFAGDGPDGKPLVGRFQDAAGTPGRVPATPATAELSVAAPGDAASPSDSPPGADERGDSAGDVEPEAAAPVPQVVALSPQVPPAGTQAIAVGMALQSAASAKSGTTFQYQVAVSCAAVVGATCDDVRISIPIPPDLNVSGATNPSDWRVSVAGTDGTLVPTVVEKVDGNWVVTLKRPLTAGEAPVFSFYVTPPNETTPNNTSWTLSATASGSNVEAQASIPTAAATATAAAKCSIVTADDWAGYVVGSTQRYAFSVNESSSSTGVLGADPAVPGIITFTVPAGFTYVRAQPADGVAATYDPATRTVTWAPVSYAPSKTPYSLFVEMTLPSAPGTYSSAIGASFQPIGAVASASCSGTYPIQVASATVTGSVIDKSAVGLSQFGTHAVAGSTAGEGRFARALRDGDVPDGSPANTGEFEITLARKNASYAVHVFDGMPCRTSGTGTSTSTPYASLPETSAPCADPAFRVASIQSPTGRELTGEKVTVEYTDGSTAVIPSGSGTWTPSPGKMVASLIIDGTYEVTDPESSKSWVLYGAPVSSVPHVGYLRNTATASGPAFPTQSVWVGLWVMGENSLVYNSPRSNTYSWVESWSGRQQMLPMHQAGVVGSGSDSVGAISTDPDLTGQPRYAVVIPAGSGINVTGVTGHGAAASTSFGSYTTVPATKTDDFDGTGATRYLVSAPDAPNALTGPGATVNFGGMLPGVYQYYTYSGFVGSDPTAAGTCTGAGGGELVTDTTGIIAPAGVARVLCKATNTIIVTSPGGGLKLTKEVANVSTGGVFQGSPAVVSSVSGDTVQFRVRIANVGTTSLTNTVIYDVLPHDGDTGVIASQAGAARGSTHTPVLSSVTAPSGWTVEYSTSFNPCRPEVGVSTGCETTTWTTSKPAVAGSLRLKAATVAGSSFADVILAYTVPQAADWEGGDVAWNSVGGTALQGALQLPPAESAKVGFGYPSGRLAWRKTDTAGEAVPGATFIVTGPGGYSVTVTDNQAPDADPADGAFLLNTGLGTGAYSIDETVAPEGYLLNPTALEATIDTAGAAVDAGTMVDEKEPSLAWRKTDERNAQLLGGATFTVTGPGGYSVTVTDNQAPDADPAAGAFLLDSGLTPGEYTITESAAPSGYELTTTTLRATVAVDERADAGTVANRRTGLSWRKTTASGASLSGATFRVTGPNGFSMVVTDQRSPDTDPFPGVLLLQSGYAGSPVLVPGEYTITEIVAPSGYALNPEPMHATIEVGGVSAYAGALVNQRIVSMFISKTGQDTTGSWAPMAGSTWQVLSDDAGEPGDPVARATLSEVADQTGVWKVGNLLPGTYWLSETTAPAGFSLLASPVQFTIDTDGQVVLGLGAGSGATAVATAASGTGAQAPWWVATVRDVPAVVLPDAGGTGSRPWTLIGSLLVAGSLLLAGGVNSSRAERRSGVRPRGALSMTR